MRRHPWASCYRSLSAFGLLVLALVGSALSENRLVVESGPGRAGPVAWRSASIEYQPGSAGGWRIGVADLAVAGQSLSLEVDCEQGAWRRGLPRCDSGRFSISGLGDEPLSGRLLAVDDATAGLRFELDDGSLSGRLLGPRSEGTTAWSASLDFVDFDLSRLPASAVSAAGLSVLEGRLSGRLRWLDGTAHADLSLAAAAFDRPDGLAAGGAIDLTLTGRVAPATGSEPLRFQAVLLQSAGELLLGPVYLPPPSASLSLELSGRVDESDRVVVESFQLSDPEALAANGSAVLARESGGWSVDRADVERFELQFPGAWRRWAEGPAAALGLGGVDTQGRLSGALSWPGNQGLTTSIDVDGVGIEDVRDRFSIRGLSGRFVRGDDRMTVDLGWSSLSLYKLHFGASELAAAGRPDDWALSRPLRLGLVDGAVVFDSLSVATDEAAERTLALDLRIEPLDLARLTRMLEFPVFGGELSGRFPGVRVTGDRIAFTGGIDVAAFSGRIGLTDLVIERPFGSLPALAAQVTFDRLDLAELTGAFNFGHMEGELSGWMRDLRLLDWQPVAMDTRVFTHADAPNRRISQRAVENLSRLGGGAAAIGATLLRVFEEFPYRRAGLACRLDRNICHIDGVAPHESGGFYIVEGRGLPHLDVVGHRRLVDWPRLVSQLVAMTRE